MLKINQNQHSGRFKLTTFICDVWIDGTCTILTGLPISAALLASGIGTLLYILITKAKIPAYLGSSFAFITPIITGLSTHSLGDMLVALFMSGLMYVIIGILIRFSGTGWLMHLLPPVVVGPVIMVIGLSLAPTAVNMAMYENSADMKVIT